MSFLAKLFINGKEINVLDTNIQFYQSIDPATYMPHSLPQGGLFKITVETTDDTDFLRLMVSSDTMCKGYIRFYRRDGLSRLIDYEFFDTYIVGHRTEFSATSNRPVQDAILFSPGILRIGDMVFEKPWKITDLDIPVKMASAQQGEPSIISCYYEDMEGTKIAKEELTVGDTVKLVLHTSNANGKTINLDLGDLNKDFEYKGERLEADILSDVLIKSSPQKFKLKILEQEEEGDQDQNTETNKK